MSELDAYDYHLPHELIAQSPLSPRSDARLLVVRRDAQTLEHRFVHTARTVGRATAWF
jgi:S-adenosylmethionine--tRNA ribosyltransferase-isomerase